MNNCIRDFIVKNWSMWHKGKRQTVCEYKIKETYLGWGKASFKKRKALELKCVSRATSYVEGIPCSKYFMFIVWSTELNFLKLVLTPWDPLSLSRMFPFTLLEGVPHSRVSAVC